VLAALLRNQLLRNLEDAIQAFAAALLRGLPTRDASLRCDTWRLLLHGDSFAA
jgi:hypothetical protein